MRARLWYVFPIVQINIDAPVKSTDPEACTQYIAVGPIQYYYIWCIDRPMPTFYETINIPSHRHPIIPWLIIQQAI